MSRSLVAAALLLVSVLPGCGGGGSTSNPTPVSTPTPAPSFSGTYAGTLLFNVQGQAEIRGPARITITQSGSSVTFGNLILVGISNGANLEIPIGAGTLVGDTVNTGTSYQSGGCGTGTSTTTARFAGNLVNLTTVLTFTGNCARSETRGELAR
jgi:hypothetical protein